MDARQATTAHLMSTEDKKTEPLEIKHYKRSHAGASSKELFTEQVTAGSATFDFIQRMEEKRLDKECFRMLDMRGKVAGECKAHPFKGQTIWLDEISRKLFTAGLEHHKGVFTVGTFESIINGLHTYKGQQAKIEQDRLNSQRAAEGKAGKTDKRPTPGSASPQTTTSPADNFEIIPLGYFHKRREERVHRITEIAIADSQGMWPAKTRDLSIRGLLIKVTPDYHPNKGDYCEVHFTSLSEESGQDLLPLQYKVVRVEETATENVIALALDPPQENTTTRALSRYIGQQLQTGLRAHKLEMTDDILTATSMLSERYYVQSSTCLSFFLARDEQGELRIQVLCLNENNRQLLKHFETLPGRYDLTGLIAPERVARFYEFGLQQGRDDPLIVVFRATAQAKPRVAAAFEFEQQDDWLRFIARLCDSHQFVILKVMLRPLQTPDPMRIVCETMALAEKSLDAAEQLIQQAQQFVASGTLVDVTREITTKLASSEQGHVETVPAQAGVSPPEILRMGYVEKYRREDRFRHAVQIEVSVGTTLVRARSRDFSVHGLSFLLSKDIPGLEAGKHIEVAFPELKHHSNMLGMLKRKHPSGRYEVVGVDRGKRVLIRMKLLDQEQNLKLQELLQELIGQNQGKLEVDLSECLRAAKSAYYSGLVAGSTVSLPVYVFTKPDGDGYLVKVGLPETPGILADFFELAEGVHDFNVLANPLRIGKLISQLKKKETAATHFYMYKARVRGEAKFKVHAMTDHEFGDSDERDRFLDQAINHDLCFAKLVLSHPKQPPPHEIDHILEPLKACSSVRAREVAGQMSQLVAVGDLVDLTRQLSEGHVFSD